MGLFDKFKKKKDFIKLEIEELIEWNEPNGEGCLATDKITKDGFKVGYMYREQPSDTSPDSGWRFFAGDEDDKYTGNADNIHMFRLNTICNYDKDIIPYLNSSIGSAYIRISSDKFEPDDGTKPVFICKQNR